MRKYDTEILEALVASSDDAIITKSLEGVVTTWNPAAERLFGYSSAEMIGQKIERLMPPGRETEEHDILARLKRGEHIKHFETQRRRKCGAVVDVSVTISPIRTADGEIVGASKIARDISESKRAEERLKQRVAETASELAAIVQTAASRLLKYQRGRLPKAAL